MRAKQRQSDDALVDKNRVFPASADELREHRSTGRRHQLLHRFLAPRGPSRVLARGVTCPKGPDGVHEYAGPLALYGDGVGTLDEC